MALVSFKSRQAADPSGAGVAPTGPDSSDTSSDPHPDRRITLFGRADLAIYGAYTAAAVFVLAGLWVDIRSRTFVANTTDHQQALWFLSHAAWALEGGHNPLTTTQLNAPDTVNMMANTSMLGLGIPMAPVTMLFGPRVTFVALVTLALAGTASAWYVVFRRTLVESRWAAAIAGAFCGFAPGMISHAGGQLNFVAQFVLPFIALAVVDLARAGATARRVLVLALLVAYQVFINEELLLLAAIGLGIFIGVYASLRWRQVRPVSAMFVKRLLMAAGVAALLLAYPLWLQFFGPGHYDGLPYDPLAYPADLQSYVAYSSQSIGGGPGAARYSNSVTEENAFFGWPLLLLCALIVGWLWRVATVRAAVAVAVVFGLLSLGESIVIGGWDTGVPGPFLLVSQLPLGELIVPSRLALVAVAPIGLLLALGLDRVICLGWRGATYGPLRAVWMAAFVAALTPLLPTPLPVRDLAPAPPFVAAGHWRTYVSPGRTVVPVPVPNHFVMYGQTWSAETRNAMAIPGGYYLGPTSESDAHGLWGPPPRPTTLLLDRVATTGVVPPITEADRDNLTSDLAFWRAAIVILGDHVHADQLRSVLEGLLGPGVERDGVWLWDVRARVGS
jgi:hypothetical protein